MKNFCIVSFCNIYVSPYAKTYIDAIQKKGDSVTLLFWDRDAVNGENDKFLNCNKCVYQRKITNASSKKEKLVGYLEATKVFKEHLRDNDYAGVILLQTHVAVACGSVIRNKYGGKYIVDIRDYTLENYRVYRRFEKMVIDQSYATIISSPAYAKFLPKHDYILAHNFTSYSKEQIDEIEKISGVNIKPIKISFIGKVRFIEQDKKLLQLFANDYRFRLCYFGTGAEILKDFCESQDIKNVEFYGSFQPDKTAEFYKKTNIINNIYGNHNPFLDYALSNKLYYAAQFHIPILVCPDTYMEEVTNKYNLGYTLDIRSPQAPNDLYNWFVSKDMEALVNGAELFLNKVKFDTEKYMKLIDDFVDLGGK